MGRKLMPEVLLCFIVLSATRLYSQDDPCANPKSPRVGVLITSKEPVKQSPDMYEYLKRQNDVDKHFQEALIKQLRGACIVRNVSVFDDPRNYPALKGSMMILISSRPSFQNPKIAAIAVELKASEGPSVDQSFSMGSIPILIEDAGDFETGAKMVLQIWSGMGEELAKKKK